MTTGGRFAPIYSEEQKAAAGECAVDLQLSAPKAAAHLAEHGYNGLPPFRMHVDTVRIAVRRERDVRAGRVAPRHAELEPAARVAAFVHRQLNAIEGWQGKLERRIDTGRAGVPEAELGKRLATWAREVRALDAGIPPSSHTGRGARKGNRPPERAPASTSGDGQLLEDMAADLRATHDRAESAAAPNGNTHTHIGGNGHGDASSSTTTPPSSPPTHQPTTTPDQ